MILDNNILFSLMKPDSAASGIFKREIEFEAPEFIKTELEEHKKDCMEKSGLTKKAFEARKEEVFSRIEFIEVEKYKRFLKKAVESVNDVDDAPYVALSLALRQPIWSNDAALKEQQKLAEVLTTGELVKLLS